jgi:hypothetical protein
MTVVVKAASITNTLKKEGGVTIECHLSLKKTISNDENCMKEKSTHD